MAALAAGCGGDDDGDGGAATTTATEAAADSAVFESEDVGFTFEYPEELRATTKPNGQVLGQVSVEKGAELNALKVRKTSDEELRPEQYLDEFQRDFSRTVGKVEKREETIEDLDVGVLEFKSSVRGVDFESASYFFRGGGKTWQLECIADTEHAAQIGDACDIALRSISFDA
jgi:hypothetical protein